MTKSFGSTTADSGSGTIQTQLLIATDRPISALEAIQRSRTLDYSISVAEFQLDADSRGEGALMVAAAIAADSENGTLVLENFGQAPVRLRNIRPQ